MPASELEVWWEPGRKSPRALAPDLVWVERDEVFRFALHLVLKTMFLRAEPRAPIPTAQCGRDIWETELRDGQDIRVSAEVHVCQSTV